MSTIKFSSLEGLELSAAQIINLERERIRAEGKTCTSCHRVRHVFNGSKCAVCSPIRDTYSYKVKNKISVPDRDLNGRFKRNNFFNSNN